MAFTNTQLGGGLFTGKAIYDSGVFPDNVAEDVSDIISMISPHETPLLSAIGDADEAATSVLHEWLEDELSPNTLASSTAMLPATTSVTIAEGKASYIMNGAILRYSSGATEEYMQVQAISGNVFTVERGFAGTTAVTIAAGSNIDVISDAATEGADATEDISRPRARLSNNCQIFKKDVKVSGTMQAVRQLGMTGISEKDYQIRKRTREALRDLEKAVILSRNANTLGSASATRTMKGLLQFLSTNSVSLPNISNTSLTAMVKTAWDQGGSDCDLIVCGQTVKQQIDLLNNSRTRTANEEGKYRDVVSVYEGTYGVQRVLLSRWMPANKGVLIATPRVKVVPLQTRSFQYQDVAKTGDNVKGFVVGEYTLQVRNEAGMAQFNL